MTPNPRRNIRVSRGRPARPHDRPESRAERLAKILRGAGAEVELRLRDTDHILTKEEVGEAKEWLSERIGYD